MSDEISEARYESKKIAASLKPAVEEESEVDLIELGKVLWSKKATIFKFAAVTALLTVVILLIIKPSYTAEADFLPPNSMSSGGATALLGQLGSLGDMGSSLGGLKDPTLIYIGILGSRSVADALIEKFDLAKVYNTSKLSQTERALKSHSKFIAGKNTIVAIIVDDHDPNRAADLANGYLAALRDKNDHLALTVASQKRMFFELQLEKAKNALADAEVEMARSQEQTGLIQPGGQAQLQIQTVVQTQAEIASREVQLAALSQAATEQNPDVIRIRSEIAGLKAQLNRLENSNSSTMGNVQIPTSKVPELTLIYVRKARELKYHEALYELLLRQYEAAKQEEARSAPLLQVVDSAIVPDTKSGPPRSLLTLLAALLGGFLGTIWVFIGYVLEKRRQTVILQRT